VQSMNEFLRSTAVIDWNHPAVAARAARLGGGADDTSAIARRCFEWVRDCIQHSSDHGLEVVTCAASAVLAHGSGFCYAKSHLLAALLRANRIPTGFCYQRLRVDPTSDRFSLHGFNAIYLPDIGWYRVDARGNRHDVDAQFTPPVERLAFQPATAGESDFPEIWTDPLPIVVETLQTYTSASVVYQRLPDVLLAPTVREP
jgi:transglutaminase-like putative cysteine protease